MLDACGKSAETGGGSLMQKMHVSNRQDYLNLS